MVNGGKLVRRNSSPDGIVLRHSGSRRDRRHRSRLNSMWTDLLDLTVAVLAAQKKGLVERRLCVLAAQKKGVERRVQKQQQQHEEHHQ